jgi:hypothetical protein
LATISSGRFSQCSLAAAVTSQHAEDKLQHEERSHAEQRARQRRGVAEDNAAHDGAECDGRGEVEAGHGRRHSLPDDSYQDEEREVHPDG